MQIYAHRAGRGLAAENTLEASETCLQYPIDFIDFDIGMTADGEIVVTHDPILNPAITRTFTGAYLTRDIQVNRVSYQELATYNVGQINPDSPYAAYFPAQRSFSFARIPLLKEAIQTVQRGNPQVKFQLEMKTNPERPEITHSPEIFAQALLGLLKEAALLDQVEIQAFDYRCLLALQKLDSQVKLAFLTDPFEHGNDPKWHAGYDLKQFGGSYPRMIHSLGGHCWGPFQMDVTEKNLAEAQSLGLKVVAWGYPEKEGTEFNKPQINRLAAWGVDGIITDRPDLMTHK